MSDNQLKLENMTKDRNIWRDRALKAEKNESQLRDMLKSIIDNANARNVGSTGEQAAIELQRDNYRRRAEEAEDKLKFYDQLEYVRDPEFFERVNSALMGMPDDQLEQLGGTKEHTQTFPLVVGYIVVARANEIEEPLFIPGIGAYFGSFEKLTEELKRLTAIIWRVPMPEDLRGPFLDDQKFGAGINRDLQLKAIQKVAWYCHDDALRDQFGERVDDVFKTLLERHFHPKDVNEARRYFRESYKNTLEAMSTLRGTQTAPKLLSGRRTSKTMKK